MSNVFTEKIMFKIWSADRKIKKIVLAEPTIQGVLEAGNKFS